MSELGYLLYALAVVGCLFGAIGLGGEIAHGAREWLDRRASKR